jgi:hypothetical protein
MREEWGLVNYARTSDGDEATQCRRSNANSLGLPEFGWIPGNPRDGRVGVKHFQTARSILVSMPLAGSSLLFGIGTLALP